MREHLELRVERRFHAFDFALYGFVKDAAGVRNIATNLVLTTQEEGLAYDPFASLNETQAQILMDDLWACGVRPTEGRGTAGQLQAVQYHLEDMRKIAFNLTSTKPIIIEAGK